MPHAKLLLPLSTVYEPGPSNTHKRQQLHSDAWSVPLKSVGAKETKCIKVLAAPALMLLILAMFLVWPFNPFLCSFLKPLSIPNPCLIFKNYFNLPFTRYIELDPSLMSMGVALLLPIYNFYFLQLTPLFEVISPHSMSDLVPDPMRARHFYGL